MPRRNSQFGGIVLAAAAMSLLLLISALALAAGASARTPESPSARAAAAGATRLLLRLEGRGSVRVTPGSRTCRRDCTARFRPRTRARLVAVPSSGWAFAGWRGSCRGTRTCRLRIGRGARLAVARFRQDPRAPVSAPPVTTAGPQAASPSSSNPSEPPSPPTPPPPSEPAPREPVNFLEDFSADRLDLYEFDYGGRADVKVEDGVLRRLTTANANLCTSPELAVAEPTVTYKFTTGADVGSALSQYPDITVKRFGGSANRLQLDYQLGDRRFKIFREVGGARSDVVVGPQTGPGRQPNTSYWLRAQIRGTVVRGELFLADPSSGSQVVPVASLEHALVGDDATRFGAGAAGTSCIAPHVYREAELAGWSVDDWRISG